MGSIDDIMQLCRLCLVKDQVNIPIFDETSDIRQTFLKINQCLPVKVSRDDNLPKKICDGCSYKLDMLYVFRNTSVDSEKQLMSWLSQAGLGSCSLPQTLVKDGVTKPEIMVKQETFEATDVRLEGDNPELHVDTHQELGVDAHSYIMQQQKLPYQQDFAAFGEPSGSTNIVSEEPPPKKAKRAAATKKHVPLETEVDEALDNAMQITKAEEEDSDDVDQPDYVEAPSTSADDQPGPSGVGKGTIEAPSFTTIFLPASPPAVCEVCRRVFATRTKLHAHKHVHKEKKVRCNHCPKTFHYNYQLTTHTQLVHEKQRTFICTICNYAAQNKLRLRAHIIVHHTKNFPFKCDLCELGYLTRMQLDSHRKVKHEGLRFICEQCKKVFKSQAYLNIHRRKHNPDHVQKAYTCQVCLKVIRTSRNFKRHMELHNGSFDSYVCDMCGLSVTTLQSLKNHRKIHTGEKTFLCDMCSKCFTTKNLLVIHRRTHTKEKPFKCTICNKCFTQKPTLNVHMRYHTGERPYKCDVCPKEFVTKTLLKNHKCKGTKS